MKQRTTWKNNNHTHVTDLPEAKLGMDVQVTADLRCPNRHELHGIKTKLVASVFLTGYIIRCPECDTEVRLLRTEFELRPVVRPKARRKKVETF